MKIGIFAMVIGIGGIAASAGCMAQGAEGEPAAAPAANTAEADGAILRLDVERGHSVAFYEPAPGGLFLVEEMAPGQSFVLSGREASDALAAFARLVPGAEVPAGLQAAYDRARAMDGGGRAPAGAASAAAPELGQQSLVSSSSAAVFVNDNHGCDWGPQLSFCRVNWANGFAAAANQATSGLCIVDHYAGNGVTIQITVGATITSAFQGVGTIAQYSLGVAGFATTRRIDVTNASGDSFHVGCRWGV
jgi:hypothetical protein